MGVRSRRCPLSKLASPINHLADRRPETHISTVPAGNSHSPFPIPIGTKPRDKSEPRHHYLAHCPSRNRTTDKVLCPSSIQPIASCVLSRCGSARRARARKQAAAEKGVRETGRRRRRGQALGPPLSRFVTSRCHPVHPWTCLLFQPFRLLTLAIDVCPVDTGPEKLPSRYSGTCLKGCQCRVDFVQGLVFSGSSFHLKPPFPLPADISFSGPIHLRPFFTNGYS